MTDFRDKPDAITQWRATVEALEALVQAAPEAEEIDPAEAEKVRRLIRIRVAAARSNNLPAAWVPRCEIAATAETVEGRKHTPSRRNRDRIFGRLGASKRAPTRRSCARLCLTPDLRLK